MDNSELLQNNKNTFSKMEFLKSWQLDRYITQLGNILWCNGTLLKQMRNV